MNTPTAKRNLPFPEVHNDVCPICKEPMKPDERIFNKFMGEVHLACILLDVLECAEGKRK